MNSTNSDQPATVTLPTPVDGGERDVVIYDGKCSFCTGQVQRIARWDRAGRLSYLSLHDPAAARQYPDLTHAQLVQEMVVVDHNGGRHGGAAAFRYLTRRLPRLWPLAPLMHIPFSLPLWQWFYHRIAERRYRLGKTVACEHEVCDAHSGK